jgi:hypothetical protein
LNSSLHHDSFVISFLLFIRLGSIRGVGAVAVIATLAYFAVQIRSLKADSLSASIGQNEQSERDLHRLYIEHQDLIRRATDAGSLSDDERFTFNEIFLSTWVFHFYSFARASANGRDPTPPASSLVRYLKRYPGFRTNFESEEFRNILDRILELVDSIYSDVDT